MAPAQNPEGNAYPGVRPELVEPILAMKAGVEKGEAEIPWRLYVPKEAATGGKLPLVVCLHGAGSRGNDNMRPMNLFRSFWSEETQRRYPAYVLTPQMKRGWVVKPGGFTNYDADATGLGPEMATMLKLVGKTIEDNPIDPDRVYVIGTSMGGYGAWEAITRRPDLWAAAVPICGGGDPEKAAVFKDIPIWVWHGSKDTTVPVGNSREMVAALEAAGARPKYSEPATGHGSWNNAFADPELYRWMFSQRRAVSR